MQSGHLQRGGAGYDPVQAYHEAREQGTGIFDTTKSEGTSRAKSGAQHAQGKGESVWNRAEDEGQSLVDSARTRGREGVQQTKAAWHDVKDSFKTAGKAKQAT